MEALYGHLQRFCRDVMVLRVRQFTKIVQRFYGAPSMSIYRNLLRPEYVSLQKFKVCQFTEIL